MLSGRALDRNANGNIYLRLLYVLTALLCLVLILEAMSIEKLTSVSGKLSFFGPMWERKFPWKQISRPPWSSKLVVNISWSFHIIAAFVTVDKRLCQNASLYWFDWSIKDPNIRSPRRWCASHFLCGGTPSGALFLYELPRTILSAMGVGTKWM